MTPRMKAAVEKASGELSQKSLHDIQVETAYTWCGRACAASHKVASGHPDVDRLLGDAIEYAHEAIEHAALSGDDAVLDEVRATLRAYDVSV
jgi:hypothetical protein